MHVLECDGNPVDYLATIFRNSKQLKHRYSLPEEQISVDTIVPLKKVENHFDSYHFFSAKNFQN